MMAGRKGKNRFHVSSGVGVGCLIRNVWKWHACVQVLVELAASSSALVSE